MNESTQKKYTSEMASLLSYCDMSIITEIPTDKLNIVHLILPMLEKCNECNAGNALKEIMTTSQIDSMKKFYQQYLSATRSLISRPKNRIITTPEYDKALSDAEKIANEMGDDKIGSEHVLIAILKMYETASVVADQTYILPFIQQRITSERFLHAIEDARDRKIMLNFDDGLGDIFKDYTDEANKTLKNKKTGAKPSNMSTLCDLMNGSKMVLKFSGHDEDMKYIENIMLKRFKNIPFIYGKSGVGKTSIIQHLANLADNITEGYFAKKQFYKFSLDKLIGMTDFRKALSDMFREVKRNPDIIVVFDRVEGVLFPQPNTLDISSLFIKAFEEIGERFILTTNESFLNEIIGDFDEFKRLATMIELKPLTEDETFQMITENKKALEDYHRVSIAPGIITKSIHLANKYIETYCLPGSAIDLLDTCAAQHRTPMPDASSLAMLKAKRHKLMGRIQTYKSNNEDEKTKACEGLLSEVEKEITELNEQLEDKKNVKYTLTEEDLLLASSKVIGTKLNYDNLSDINMLKSLTEKLTDAVIGQGEACKAISNAVRKSMLGIADENRPLSFLFIGNSGVGKTYLAKKLSEYVFGSEKDMIRVDMSEYAEAHSISKLIGAPPGYIGFDNNNNFLNEVSKKKRCVLLLDEIEKAHTAVYNLLLQMLDDGRLTNSKGETISFKNVIIIMTSNVGTRMANEVGGGVGFVKNANNSEMIIRKETQKHFPPEFLNRIGSIIYFNNLSDDNLKTIINKELGKKFKQLNNMKTQFSYNIGIVDNILEECKKDNGSGARPVLRAIDKLILDPLCNKMLEISDCPEYAIELTDSNEIVVGAIYEKDDSDEEDLY